jgi:hypothetical protein
MMRRAHRIARNCLAATAVAATFLAPLDTAEAGERWRHHHRDRHVEMRDHDVGALVAAGVLGLAVGALVAGAAQQPQWYDPYDDPYADDYYYYRPRADHYDYFPPAPVDRGRRTAYRGAEPWTPEWYAYCQARYRSFNPRTGTFRGYDGRNHFCVAR